MRRLVASVAILLLLAGAGSAATADAPFIAGDPSWSPDGRALALDGSFAGTAPDIYTVRVDGSDLRNLTADDPAANLLPSWGRRLREIAYETDVSDAQVVNVRYSLIASGGGTPRQVASSSALGPIWWSGGDRLIAFDGRLEAYVARTQGSRIASLADSASGPWSPRASTAVFALATASGAVHLYTVTDAARVARRLTSGRENVRALAWTRDGRWIIFTGARGGTGFNLYAVRMAGGRPRLLAARARQADVAPRGGRVVYSPDSGGIFTVGIDGRARRRLTSDGANPRWSPSGDWIAFQAGSRIDLVRPNGSQRHSLVGH